MTIAITVRNFRGCVRADLVLDLICLLAGKNHAGKSSVAMAAACAATGLALPLGITAKTAKHLVHDAANTGAVTLSDGEARAEIVWPTGEVDTRGTPPRCSEVAVGLDRFADQDAKTRAATISKLLKSEPTQADLAAWLGEQGITKPEAVATVWKGVLDDGWDDAAVKVRTAGIKLKGQWEEVTGQKYGKVVGVQWRPASWSAEFIDATEPALREAAQAAAQALEDAIANQAVGAAEIERLQAKAAEIPQRREEATRAIRVRDEAANKVTAQREHRATLPRADDGGGMPCPHCGKPVAMRQVRLGEWQIEKVPPALDAETLKQRRMDIAGADGKLSKLVGEHAQAERIAATAANALELAIAAAETLKDRAEDGVSAEAITDARSRRVAAEARLAAFVVWNRAADLHDQIAANQIVLDALAPTGVRQKKLAEALDAFNDAHLGPLCEAAGWPAITILPTLAVTLGGRDYRLCADSEQLCVDYALQVATARLDGSSFVVLDRADTLVGADRNGLFALLAVAQVPALVCMSLARREMLPDLAAKRLGNSVWIEKGVA